MTAQIEPVCRAHARGCQVVVTQISETSPIHFGSATVDAIRHQAANLGFPHMDIFSGAGHDAGHLASVCPTGMLFVPCEKGISHNEVENARPADLAAGAQVLASFLLERANR
ncbi:MAG: hypothetical protein ETSY1_16720 [Candidatus Entotheonella factor]|uniref:Peptidase M20 dimerisation domain-containing protein n=1 Tax=Entotheonella factor TaxID=1429438 RepID=W4LNK7_ENTF1|nr:MAG: hypothetical protein ETSY1_16720 [Candidatus Entotheonella factor]